METRSFEEFGNSFQNVIKTLVCGEEEREGGEESVLMEEGGGGGEEGGRGDGEEGRVENKERCSKTDSESHSSEDSAESDSSDDSSPSTNQNTTESHVTKSVDMTTEAARLAAKISGLDEYDPPYPELALTATLHLFYDIVRMKDRLEVARLLQEVCYCTIM